VPAIPVGGGGRGDFRGGCRGFWVLALPLRPNCGE